MDSPTVMYSWNSAGILDTALFNSSIAFEPTLLSGAIKLKRCQLGMRIIHDSNERNDYRYFSINFNKAIETKSWVADNRMK